MLISIENRGNGGGVTSTPGEVDVNGTLNPLTFRGGAVDVGVPVLVSNFCTDVNEFVAGKVAVLVDVVLPSALLVVKRMKAFPDREVVAYVDTVVPFIPGLVARRTDVVVEKLAEATSPAIVLEVDGVVCVAISGNEAVLVVVDVVVAGPDVVADATNPSRVRDVASVLAETTSPVTVRDIGPVDNDEESVVPAETMSDVVGKTTKLLTGVGSVALELEEVEVTTVVMTVVVTPVVIVVTIVSVTTWPVVAKTMAVVTSPAAVVERFVPTEANELVGPPDLKTTASGKGSSGVMIIMETS
jgi:hypothetical protein